MHQRIARLLEESGTSQSSLARAIGISQAAISRWLKPPGQGGVEPEEENLQRAASFFSDALGRRVTVSYIRYGERQRDARVPVLTWARRVSRDSW